MKIGQIVEIPENSPIYKREKPSFQSKEEELLWKIDQRNYSLFDGFIVGEHNGVEKFEIGQRKGLNIGGKKDSVYVIEIDKLENRIFVGQGKFHPGLFTDVFCFEEQHVSWLEKIEIENGMHVKVSSSILLDNIDAKFYQFDQNYYLEFENQVPLILKNYTIGLSYENKDVIILIK